MPHKNPRYTVKREAFGYSVYEGKKRVSVVVQPVFELQLGIEMTREEVLKTAGIQEN